MLSFESDPKKYLQMANTKGKKLASFFPNHKKKKKKRVKFKILTPLRKNIVLAYVAGKIQSTPLPPPPPPPPPTHTHTHTHTNIRLWAAEVPDLQLESKTLWFHIFQRAFFQFWKQIKVTGCKVLLYGGLENNWHLKELIISTVDEAVLEEALSCKRRKFFWASLGRNFFSVFLWVFFFFFFFFFFFNYFSVVSGSHSSTFWHEASQCYSMWIPQSNQYNLASRWRQLNPLAG